MQSVGVPSAMAFMLPFIIAVSYIAPSAAMFLPAPSIVSVGTKQALAAAWQPFPIYTSVLTSICSLLPSYFFSDSDKSGPATLRGLRRTYAFALACAVILRIAAWALSLTALAFPTLFPENVAAELHPLRVFVNTLPRLSPSVQVTSAGEGALWFLQWDDLIGSTALLLWALALYKAAHQQVSVELRWAELGWKVVLLSVAIGPVGAAVVLIWARDELVFEKASRRGENGHDRKTR